MTTSGDRNERGGLQGAPRVSVIIPNYREFDQLDACLTALQSQTFPADSFEIVVADNNSPEGEAAVAAVIRGRARLVIVREKGAGCARNGGVAVSRGEILAFTDSDCVPEPGWIEEGVKALDSTDIVGGRMVVLVDDTQNMTPAEGFETIFAFNNELYVRKKGFTVTANLLCRRTVFDKVGGFLAAGMAEDFEWCQRAVAAGFTLGYAPTSVVGHPARKDWVTLLKKWRRVQQDNFGMFCLQNNGGRVRWAFRSLVLPFSALAHSPRVLFDKRLNSLSLRFAVLGTLFRLRLWRLVNAFQLALERPRAPS